jgi:hypothetical protein
MAKFGVMCYGNGVPSLFKGPDGQPKIFVHWEEAERVALCLTRQLEPGERLLFGYEPVPLPE